MNSQLLKPTGSDQKKDQKGRSHILFEALCRLRLEISKQEEVMPLNVFSDNTLRIMERFLPVTRENFLQIPGVSEAKLEKYGEHFLEVIRSHCTEHGLTRVIPDKQHFHVNQLKGYLNEMKDIHTKITCRHMIHLLIANAKTAFTEEEKALSFFGKLEGSATIKTLAKPIKNFFTAYVDSPVNELVENYFTPPFYNRLEEISEKGYYRQIRQIPLQRSSETIVNPYIIEQRKNFPRAYEPWSEPELRLYEELLEQTNDIYFLCRLFQRNPGNMKQVFKKIKGGNIPEEQ